MSARRKSNASPMADALRAEKEGVAFFEQAQRVVNDPRVREIFKKLAQQKRQHVKSLENIFERLDIEIPGTKRRPEFYPLAELRRAECYVCGYAANAEAVPESCPRCGASRYAFEKEIGARKAWDYAEKGAVLVLRKLGQAEKRADARTRSAMAGHIRLEQRFLREVRKEIESRKK